MELISQLDKSEVKAFLRLSQKYYPSSRSLLGAILGQHGGAEFLKVLPKSLHPVTPYQLPAAGVILSTSQNWTWYETLQKT